MEDIQFLSDLHLEEPLNYQYFKTHPIIPQSKYLVIGGDLIDYNNIETINWFFDDCSQLFKTVFIVFGNHDFYNFKIPLSEMNLPFQWAVRKNIFYVNNISIVFNTTEIFFTTLWSLLDKTKKEETKQAPEFRYIKYTKTKLLDLESYNKTFENTHLWLANKIQTSTAKHKIVFTHHCPTKTLETPRDNWFTFFRSDCDDLIQKTDLWVFGHTHKNVKTKKIGNALLATNQFGHLSKNENFSFDGEMTTKKVFKIYNTQSVL
ncbi:hypothetical protein EIN_095870 [Entamoeba invadens IP1]|uniref:Calcineurin-like phosphoesterase domain-containing protein n=1 Tax=Entamoeba invadens IP1 TaxID=370355 RepID=A0A0A1U0B2_ENTIV|nr:hypothetical protein EIN_095870 [Entamoeba invadens IP1]ELP87330.1 hypothetical protein EIN_095870 [Entamoeba invadens IP1]|eukprot:XP_004254101.1 hypothetical protein EIN_095870 [Entamoeba invadens IP1]